MARTLFGVEKGVRLFTENGAEGVDTLFGAAIPGGDSNSQDAAPVGSVYMRTTGELYQKKASANATTDWIRLATLDDVYGLAWRSERVIAATGDVAPSTGAVIDLAATPFGDDQAPLLTAASFAVNDRIIFGVGGTPVIMRVSVVSSPNITVVTDADPLSANDTFVVQNYLPDSPADQEDSAIVHFNGTAILKLSDFNWSLATGINLSGSYAGSGANALPTAGDSVETALQKLDANQRDLTTLSGVAIGSVDLGTFSGDIIPDNVAVKPALQALETELVDTRQNVDDLIALSGVAENATTLGTFTGAVIPDNVSVKSALQSLESALEGRTQATAVTTVLTLDSALVDDVLGSEWELHIREDANPARVRMEKIRALHNGTAAADATTIDDSTYGVIKLGANFNATVSVDLNGTGAGQVMRLRVASTSAGATFTARRYLLK